MKTSKGVRLGKSVMQKEGKKREIAHSSDGQEGREVANTGKPLAAEEKGLCSRIHRRGETFLGKPGSQAGGKEDFSREKKKKEDADQQSHHYDTR